MTHVMTRLRTVLQRRHQRRDEGFTLVELLVAMGIFTVVIAISVAGIASMAKDTKTAQSSASGASAARKAFLTLDRQVRYAAQLEPVTSSGGYLYFRFQSNQDTAGSKVSNPICTEWRQHTSGGAELQMRTWTAASNHRYPSTGYRTMATGLASPTTSVFTVTQPTSSVHFAQVKVAISVSKGSGDAKRASDIRTTLVARNSEVHDVRYVKGIDDPTDPTPPTPCPWN